MQQNNRDLEPDNGNSLFLGMPGCLLPSNDVGDLDRYMIADHGLRNLLIRPFDYRNPFPLKPVGELRIEPVNGANTQVNGYPSEERADDAAHSFDYYLNDNAIIGLPGGPECAIVDICGTLRYFSGAWLFGITERVLRPDMRIRKLVNGRIPILTAEVSAENLDYRFEYYAFEIPSAPEIEYPVQGNGSYSWIGGVAPKGRNLFFSVECRCSVPEGEASHRSASPVLFAAFVQQAALCAGAFYGKPRYAPQWSNISMERIDAAVWRVSASFEDGVYTLAMLEGHGFNVEPTDRFPDHLPDPIPSSPLRDARMGLRIAAETDTSADPGIRIIVPCFPLLRETDIVLRRPDAQGDRQRTIELWDSRGSDVMHISIPEAKVSDAFHQAINHMDMCGVKLDFTEFPTPGPSGGHHIFYDRDSIDLIHAYDIIGEHDRAERMIDHFWLRNVYQESSGMLLWLLGKHYDLHPSIEWVQRMMPKIGQCMSWLIGTWTSGAEENDGLLPPSAIGDNELAQGRYVSFHLYAVSGSAAAVSLARRAGIPRLADLWEQFHHRFRDAVISRLGQLVGETGGVITPTFEGHAAEPVTMRISWVEEPYETTPAGAYGKTGGVDWHNLTAVFPSGVLGPHHPWIDSSLRRWRHAYVEGVFPYAKDGDYSLAHNYNSLNLAETWLRRGDHAEALRDLYGAVLHTSATHASAEVADTSGRLDFNCTPHNWFSAKLIRFIRDCLVYEDGDGFLHLLAGLSPAWMKGGMTVGVENAPTEYGVFTFNTVMADRGFSMVLKCSTGERPPVRAFEGYVLHLPPFLIDPVIEVSGRDLPVRNGQCRLMSDVREIHVRWTNVKLPDISFHRVVASYLADYTKRLEELNGRTG